MTEVEKLQAQTGALMALVRLVLASDPLLQKRLTHQLPDLQGLLLSGPLTDAQNAEFVRVVDTALGRQPLTHPESNGSYLVP